MTGGDVVDDAVPQDVRALRRRGLAAAIAIAGLAALPIGVLGLGTARGTFLFLLAAGLLAMAVAVLRGRVDLLVVRPALLMVIVPAVLAYTGLRIATLDSGNDAADMATALLVAFQGGVGVAAASYFILPTRRAAVIGMVSVVGLHTLAIVAHPAAIASTTAAGEVATSAIGALTVLAFIHLPSVNTDLLEDATRDAVQERDLRRTIQAMAAHDIRSPLAVAATGLDTLRLQAHELPPDRFNDVLRLVDGAVRRAVALSDDLLSESIEAQRNDVPVTAGLRTVVEAAIAVSRISAEDVEVVGCDFDVEVPPRRFERLLVNLLDNAAKHGAPPVVVAGERVGHGWRVSVTDAGPGLGPDLPPGRLFEAGVRGADDGGGQGLGLFIVQQFASSFGADVLVEEPADGGTRFTVTVAG